MDALKNTFAQVDPQAWVQLEAWAGLLREWNAKINLVSRKDIDQLETRHLAHCLAVTDHLRLMHGARILDVGTGGGFPGIIMAICYPQAHFTLIDSIGKKITVVRDLADRLGLKNVEARQCRAEAMPKQFDFVTGRAVKNLPEFFSWIKANLRRGQRHSLANGVLYWKGGALEEELGALGIRPRTTIVLEDQLADPFFAQKYILHFDARDVPRARSPRAGHG
jgi:16S rRNA (guanine527-N7)-methyltransferase